MGECMRDLSVYMMLELLYNIILFVTLKNDPSMCFLLCMCASILLFGSGYYLCVLARVHILNSLIYFCFAVVKYV